MKIIEIKDFSQETVPVWTFTEIGDGQLEQVISYNRETGWLRTVNQRSYMVCPTEYVFTFDTKEEMVETEAGMKHELHHRRMDRVGWNHNSRSWAKGVS